MANVINLHVRKVTIITEGRKLSKETVSGEELSADIKEACICMNCVHSFY